MAAYDVVIIGGGPGGYVAAIRAAQLGLKAALVEQDRVGGLCLNWGCIPSKALLHSADILETIKGASKFGITVDGVHADLSVAVDQSRKVVDRMVRGVEFLLDKNGVAVFQGQGYVRSLGQVEVRPTGDVLETKNMIIATGARNRTIPGLEVDGQQVITSHEALELREVPPSIVIVGGGPLGVEFAYLYRAFGSQVTILEMLPHLLPGEDEEMGTRLERAFAQQGIQVLTNARVRGLERNGESVRVVVEALKGEIRVEGSKVLVGIGMQANSDGLGLEQLGVDLDRGFIRINERMATNVPGIYAIGDVTGPPLLAHVASAQGVVAVEGIAGKEPQQLSYDDMPRATYCRPQVASLGLTEAQARERGYQVQVGKFPFRANGKAMAIGEEEGMAKVVMDARYGDILGFHLIGPEVTELISEVSLARLLEVTPAEIGMAVHPHPTLSEVVKEAALAAQGEAVHFWYESRAGGRVD